MSKYVITAPELSTVVAALQQAQDAINGKASKAEKEKALRMIESALFRIKQCESTN